MAEQTMMTGEQDQQLNTSFTDHDSKADDEISGISGETLEKARSELGEDPLTRKEVIAELRGKIENWKPSKSEEKGITLTNTEGRFLLMFLRARKFDVDKAFQLYINYHTFRHKHANMLTDLNLKSVEHVLHSRVIQVLDSRCSDGSKVLCVYPKNWDISAVPFVDNFRATFLILDRLIEDEETQVHGFSVVYNFTDSSFMSMLKVAQSELITKGVLIELLQESFPARFKGVHLMHQPWYVSMVLSVIRPFMKQKLRDRIHSHGDDLSSMYDFIDEGSLPVEFGGTLDCDNNATFKLFQDQL